MLGLRRQNQEKMKNNKLLIILIAIILFGLILNILILKNSLKAIEIKEIDARIIVSDKVGFDLNSSALVFGEVLRGGSSSRGVIIENNLDYPLEIEIYAVGGIKDFIMPIKEEINGNEKKTITITAVAPENSELKEYTGKIIFRMNRV